MDRETAAFTLAAVPFFLAVCLTVANCSLRMRYNRFVLRQRLPNADPLDTVPSPIMVVQQLMLVVIWVAFRDKPGAGILLLCSLVGSVAIEFGIPALHRLWLESRS